MGEMKTDFITFAYILNLGYVNWV